MDNEKRELLRTTYTTSFVVSLFMAIVLICGGCAYKGGKIVDGTNIAIGVKVPGTDWSLSVLDYVGGLRVAGNDATTICVTNEVSETNEYFGCVTTHRHTRMSSIIVPNSETNRVEAQSESKCGCSDYTCKRRCECSH